MTLTTKQAAELCGMSPSHFRGEMTRERGRGRDYRLPADRWPDERSPRWDGDALRVWLVSRPGPGNWAKDSLGIFPRTLAQCPTS